MHDGIFSESNESDEKDEVPTCVLQCLESLLALCSILSA